MVVLRCASGLLVVSTELITGTTCATHGRRNFHSLKRVVVMVRDPATTTTTITPNNNSNSNSNSNNTNDNTIIITTIPMLSNLRRDLDKTDMAVVVVAAAAVTSMQARSAE